MGKAQGTALRRLGRRKVVVTPVFETLWRFAAERQRTFFRRAQGYGKPWTDDAVISEYRFTNAYRAADRVSQYLIGAVIADSRAAADDVFVRVMLFKLFNRISTWQLLEQRIGRIGADTFDAELLAAHLDEAMADGATLYSAAYIIPPPAMGAHRKHRNHLRLLERMLHERVPDRIAEANSVRDVYELLCSYPGIGRFLAYQFTIDLNYSDLIDFDEMDFVVPGPGAASGIAKCFSDTGGLDNADLIRRLTETAADHFDAVNEDFLALWGRPLHLIDVQNLLCEVDKYARVAHPHLANGRVRIKQRYRPNPNPIVYEFPAGWGLDPSAPVPVSSVVGDRARGYSSSKPRLASASMI